MGEDFNIFGRLSQMNPAGKTRNSKEIPVDHESQRRPKKKKKRPRAVPQDNLGEEEEKENLSDDQHSGKVVDIII